ncbi:MAG TPA: GntR family transcriptional regulator [Rubrivivax sp.]|nr:GntR family transcriptional regulator [Rubrivivax sp.]HPO18108.1 GntR family transcriptional regulator [Rubrivivax sp.]
MMTQSRIAERVIESILSRQLRPGERLGEQELAELFGVSRTLVREALIKLQARGFVEVKPRMGWYVVEPSFDEARETYAARRVIEPGMLRDAGRPLQGVIRKLRQHVADERRAIETRDAGTRSELLAGFHVCLAECLGNRFLTAAMVELSARTTLVSALYQSASEAQDSNDDHARIVDALADGDNARAERLMIAHIDSLASRLDASRADSARASDRLRQALGPEAALRAGPRSARGA